MGYQSFLLETTTPIVGADAANFVFAVGSYNDDRDKVPDVYCLKRTNTGTGMLEVHILSGAKKYDGFGAFLLHIGVPKFTQADAAANFVFAVGALNTGHRSDLYCLKRTNTKNGTLEVHVLNGADNYRSFHLQVGTEISEAGAANFAFAVGDYDRDGKGDLYCLKRTNTETGKLEVHILDGADNYQSFLLHTATPISLADAANFAFAVGDYNEDGTPDLYCIKHTNTSSGKLEVRVLSGASTVSPAQVLPFNMQRQKQSNWCWSAVATSTSLFYNPSSTWSQCKLVNAELGQTTCCRYGGSIECNQAWYLDRALTRTGNLDQWTGSAQSFGDISRQIASGLPLGARIGWSGGGGHFVIINGYGADQMITVSDPITGTWSLSLSEFTNHYQGSGQWTHSYFTRKAT